MDADCKGAVVEQNFKLAYKWDMRLVSAIRRGLALSKTSKKPSNGA